MLPAMTRAAAVPVLLLAVVVLGCDRNAATAADGMGGTDGTDGTDEAGLLDVTGTIHHVPLEGGFHILRSDAGVEYRPLDLPEAFQEEGLRVRAELRPRDVMGFQMRGKPVEVVRIERVEP